MAFQELYHNQDMRKTSNIPLFVQNHLTDGCVQSQVGQQSLAIEPPEPQMRVLSACDHHLVESITGHTSDGSVMGSLPVTGPMIARLYVEPVDVSGVVTDGHKVSATTEANTL